MTNTLVIITMVPVGPLAGHDWAEVNGSEATAVYQLKEYQPTAVMARWSRC